MLYNKTIGVFFLVNIRISQPSKVMFNKVSPLWLTNPDVNLIRMHQLYNVPCADPANFVRGNLFLKLFKILFLNKFIKILNGVSLAG